MIRYYIENYYSGLPILDDNDCYTRYFDNYELANDYLELVNDDLKKNDMEQYEEDPFYVVKEVNGKRVPIEL